MSYQQRLEALPFGLESVRTVFETARVEVTAEVAAAIAAGAADNQTGKTLDPDGIVFPATAVTESGAMPAASFVELDSELAAIAMTMTPTPGLLLVVRQKDAGTAGHTVTTAGTYDGTNNTATFNAANEALVLFGLSSTRWAIVQNIGSVGLSAV